MIFLPVEKGEYDRVFSFFDRSRKVKPVRYLPGVLPEFPELHLPEGGGASLYRCSVMPR